MTVKEIKINRKNKIIIEKKNNRYFVITKTKFLFFWRKSISGYKFQTHFDGENIAHGEYSSYGIFENALIHAETIKKSFNSIKFIMS